MPTRKRTWNPKIPFEKEKKKTQLLKTMGRAGGPCQSSGYTSSTSTSPPSIVPLLSLLDKMTCIQNFGPFTDSIWSISKRHEFQRPNSMESFANAQICLEFVAAALRFLKSCLTHPKCDKVLSSNHRSKKLRSGRNPVVLLVEEIPFPTTWNGAKTQYKSWYTYHINWFSRLISSINSSSHFPFHGPGEDYDEMIQKLHTLGPFWRYPAKHTYKMGQGIQLGL